MHRFLVFHGNNSEAIQQSLERRPSWKSAIDIPKDIEDYLFGKMPPPSDQSYIRFLEQRKRAVHRLTDLQARALVAQEFNFVWRPVLFVGTDAHGKSVSLHSHVPDDEALRQQQLVNHFPGIRALTTKTGLIRSLRTFYQPHNLEVFDHTPTTFIVTTADASHTGGGGGSEWHAFLRHFKLLAQRRYDCEGMPFKHCQRNMWIVKPSNMNQGRGIQVFHSVSLIRKFIADSPPSAEWIVQKYLERPLLVWGRKFDIRVWVVVRDEGYEVYFYREGYLRTSSEEYSLAPSGDSKASQMVHLTNYCMQRHSNNLGRFEDGNTLSFDDLQAYLDQHHPDAHVDVRKHIISRVKAIIADTMRAVRGTLNADNPGRRCFELFGYDFMVDTDYRVWLIEVNTNPFLGVQNKWHGDLVADMVEDMVQLCVDPMFPPPPTWTAPPAREGPMQAPPSPQRRRRSISASSDDAASSGPEQVGRGWFDLIWSEAEGFEAEAVLQATRDLEWYYPTGVPNGLRAPPHHKAPSNGARSDKARDRAAGYRRPPRADRGRGPSTTTAAAAAAAAAAVAAATSDGRGSAAGAGALPNSARDDCATSVDDESQAAASDSDPGPQPPASGSTGSSRRARHRRWHAQGEGDRRTASGGDDTPVDGAGARPHSALSPSASSRGVPALAPPKSPRARAARAAKQLRRALYQLTAPGREGDSGSGTPNGGEEGVEEEDASAEQAVFAPALSLLRARVISRSRHGLLDVAARIEAQGNRRAADDAAAPAFPATGASQSGILRALTTLAEAVEDPAGLHAAVDAGALPALWLMVAPAGPCSAAVQRRSATTLAAVEARMRGLHRRTHWSDLLPALSAVVQAAAGVHAAGAAGQGTDGDPLPEDMGAQLQEAALAELAQLYRTSRAHGSRELGAALARSGALLVAASCAEAPGIDGPGPTQALSRQAQRHARAVLRRAPVRELEEVTGTKLPVLPTSAAWGSASGDGDGEAAPAVEDSWGQSVPEVPGSAWPEGGPDRTASGPVAWGEQQRAAGRAREPGGLLLPPPRFRTGQAKGDREAGPGMRRSSSRAVLATSPIHSPAVTPRGGEDEAGPARLPRIGSQPPAPRESGSSSAALGTGAGGVLPAIRALGSGDLAAEGQSPSTSARGEIWPLPPRHRAPDRGSDGQGSRVDRRAHGQRCASASGRSSPTERLPRSERSESREQDSRHTVPRRPTSVRTSPCQAETPPLQSWREGGGGGGEGSEAVRWSAAPGNGASANGASANGAAVGETSLDTAAAAAGSNERMLGRAPDWLRTLRSEAALLEAGAMLREELSRRAKARQRERWEAAQAAAEKRREAERRNGTLNYEAWCAAVAERERVMKEQQEAEAEAQRQRREEEEAERRAKEAALAARRAELKREHRDQERRREEERQQKLEEERRLAKARMRRVAESVAAWEQRKKEEIRQAEARKAERRERMRSEREEMQRQREARVAEAQERAHRRLVCLERKRRERSRALKKAKRGLAAGSMWQSTTFAVGAAGMRRSQGLRRSEGDVADDVGDGSQRGSEPQAVEVHTVGPDGSVVIPAAYVAL